MSPSEIVRRLGNIIQVGTISETKSKKGKSLARVVLDDDGENRRVSKFLPVVSFANSFAAVWFPIRVKEQVLVISPFGNANSGFIIRSIFNKGCKEPSGANEHTSIIEFEDGTRISYDSKGSDLKIEAVKSINIICKTATIVANEITVNAVTTHTGDVTINGKLTVSELLTAENITAKNEIIDSRGSVTNHTNNGQSRD
jgi:phage baseplate assembly protein V